eukprot:TRINITY_DN8805_c0_g2_i2.p2 TRINITY_DN8805_c0_g2~~TRINITY_DN8805_c0_g2_i2.p2  ORF type:complete len:222 (-),score=3.13 TRINITY_DN8805_c0_g2_i2:88-753(-)
MMQFLKALEYLHQRSIFHRDLKTSNLLYTNKGILKVCDFGLARKFSSLPRPYTPVVVTLWYRAPEVLLGCDKYSAAIDIWSAGCIFAELISRQPLFPGKNEIEELDLIFRQFGTPTEDTWPGWHDYKYASNIKFKQHQGIRLEDKLPKGVISDKGLNLLKEMLMMNPSSRISASKALKHPWFKEQPFAQNEELMPTFKPMNEMPREMRRKSMKKKILLDKQ